MDEIIIDEIEIKFTKEELKEAEKEAIRRQTNNEKKGLKGRNGGSEKGKKALRDHKYGALGEMAVAKYLNLKDYLFLDDSPKKGSCDLPYSIDVKTRSQHRFDLAIQLDDNPDKIFVLVTIDRKNDKKCLIRGWVRGKDRMKPVYIKEYVKDRPAFYIPKYMLYPMKDLIEFIKTETLK